MWKKYLTGAGQHLYHPCLNHKITREELSDMINILGFNFYTPEERRQQEKEYSLKMFPYGDPQREKIAGILQEICPAADQKSLLFYYLVFKQTLMEETSLSVPQVLKKAKLRTIPKGITEQTGQAVRRLVLFDLEIDEQLSYPSASVFLQD